MIDLFFSFLTLLDDLFWGYIAFILIIALGSYLTMKNKFFQIVQFPNIWRTFFYMLKDKQSEQRRGVHPFKAFFASLGAMVGIGNVVGVVTAVQIGGPGALFWVWIAGIIGAIVKYSEIYLGIIHRKPNAFGSFNGGPMYFLKKAFKSSFIPVVVAILLCIYGVEIYQFSVVTSSISSNWHINRYFVMIVFLTCIVFGSMGGVRRIGQISSYLMPIFIVMYVGMGLYVIIQGIDLLPSVLLTVVKSAFTGHAATGGFAGATMILAIHYGTSSAAYSSDSGIGFDSIIQSESNTSHPQSQACLAIVGVGIDNLICTMSVLIVLLTGIWKSTVPIEAAHLVQTGLSYYFPYMNVFIPLFLLIAGYTTFIAYLCVGLKCAEFLLPKMGRKIYLIYALCALVLFSFVGQKEARLVMSVSGSLLLMINLFGIFRLKDQIVFSAKQTYLPRTNE